MGDRRGREEGIIGGKGRPKGRGDTGFHIHR